MITCRLDSVGNRGLEIENRSKPVVSQTNNQIQNFTLSGLFFSFLKSFQKRSKKDILTLLIKEREGKM